jgi:multicomponent Na+:H+ antiporter subunit D
VAGILLHRFESVDEFDLYAKGRGQRWTAAVFFAGGIALCGLPFSGLAAGDDLMHASATAAGFDWTKWISLFAGAVTSAAVLRAGGRIFFGWGPAGDQSRAPKHEEKPETERGHDHTPATMFISAAVLVAAGLLVGLTPNLKPAASTAAIQFENTNAYAAHVLDAQPAPIPAPPRPAPSGMLINLVTVLAAITIAAVHLFSNRARDISAAIARPLDLLHRIHSGHIGDYVAFLTFGMACFGLLCAYCFR